MKYCITKGYHLYLKLFKQNSLASITINLWQAILISIKHENSLAGSIIDRVSEQYQSLCQGLQHSFIV